MSKSTNILLAGFGGQGILFAGKVIAYAGLMDSMEVSWLPSYGPEMRGGTANCSVCLSNTPIGSPQVVTPDVLIAMNLPSLDKFVDAVDKYDVVIMNFANGDMVGHTGFVEAGIAACEAVDSALEKCVKKVLELGGKLLITADHGNAEHMRNEDGSPNTAHTTNLVDLIYVADDKDQVTLSDGILADVAPTLLSLMGLKQPAEMSGHSLVTPGK